MSWRLQTAPCASCFRRAAQSQHVLHFVHRQLRLPIAGCLTARSVSLLASHTQVQRVVKDEHRSRGLPAFPRCQLSAWAGLVRDSHGACLAASRRVCQATALLDVSQQQNASKKAQPRQLTMDYTALVASVAELTASWIPAKVEQVVPTCLVAKDALPVSHVLQQCL